MVEISDDIIQDDKFVMTALSVDLPEYPPIPGITRAKVHLHTLTPSHPHTITPSLLLTDPTWKWVGVGTI